MSDYLLFLNRIAALRRMVATAPESAKPIWQKHLDALIDVRSEVAHERFQANARSVC
mgnify:CR=1 FL=1|tara:strand:+ start:1692 stop:1862 length:171 start_codon:yes stop_codon:yes gene_type:complete